MNNHVVNKVDEAGKKSMRTRIITALILLLVGGSCMFLGSYFIFAFALLGVIGGVYEFTKATGKFYKWYILLICYVVTISILISGIVKGNINEYIANPDSFVFSLDGYVSSMVIPLGITILGVFAFFAISIFKEDFKVEDVTYLSVMCVLIGLGFQALLMLRFYPFFRADVHYTSAVLNSLGFKWFKSALLITFCVFVTFMNDGMAYFVGIFFGKHKLNPRISPKKTIEGFVGGWALATILTCAICFIFDSCGFTLLPGILDLEHWYLVTIIAILLPLLGNLGDFSFSLIKRHYGIKDYGWIIVGHGGVLDRVDSLLFTSLGFALLLSIIETGIVVGL